MSKLPARGGADDGRTHMCMNNDLMHGHSDEWMPDRLEAIRAWRQKTSAPHPTGVMLWLAALRADLGRNVDEWMRLRGDLKR
jgi:hypothetical protein